MARHVGKRLDLGPIPPHTGALRGSPEKDSSCVIILAASLPLTIPEVPEVSPTIFRAHLWFSVLYLCGLQSTVILVGSRGSGPK